MKRRPRLSWLGLAAAAASVAFVLVSPAGAVLGAPAPASPDNGAVLEAVPAFSWTPISGVARYEWEIAADPGFNSPVTGLDQTHQSQFFTRSTTATLTKTIPDGEYWWHVRGVKADGSVGPWSPARSFVKQWAEDRFQPELLAPANGGDITYPTDVFRLAWTPVPQAVKYVVSVATDPSLGSLVWSGSAKETQASSYTPLLQLAPGQTYYWGVTPIDAEGNRGAASDVSSFVWKWNSQTTTSRQDVAPEPEIYDWQFSWNPVPGAAGYELEVSTSSDFAPGSRVCCDVNFSTKVTTIGTKYTPTIALKNNTYYWRVRAVDPSRNAGQWNVGTPFFKSFDDAPPSIENLRMLDNPFPTEPSFETSTPIVAWDPVPGASSYEVEVTPYAAGFGCNWTATSEHWKSSTTTTSWTPLGNGWSNVKPFIDRSSNLPVAWDLTGLVAGHTYCVRVTALDRRFAAVDPYVESGQTYLPAFNEPAFTWTGPPVGGACSPSCNPNSLGSGDYLGPIRGVVTDRMPLFRWKPIAGAGSYYVLVSKDPIFSNLVDYAFTKVPAYAPRQTFGTTTYPDETADTPYYWAVLPAADTNGNGVTTAPEFSVPQQFFKQSPAPELLAPADGAVFPGAVTFSWAPVLTARHYHLQVSTDPSFAGGVIENVQTDSTSFTSTQTYPADTKLYWRVSAIAENTRDPAGLELTWSNEDTTPDLRSFRKTLAAPVPDADNPTSGIGLPTWSWSPVPGAVSYDFELELPNHTPNNFFGLPSAAAVPVLLKGVGTWHWKVRANFPQADRPALTDGPWSERMAFTRTIPEPPNARETVTGDSVLLRWDPRLGAYNYRVQIAKTEDFSVPVELVTTDNTSYAPRLMLASYLSGGMFYWRVAAADDVVANVGAYTAPRSFTFAGAPVARTATSLTAQVTKTARKVKVSGTVFPHATGRVTAKLYRKKNGAFKLLATKRPSLSATSSYKASFGRPRHGSCKIVAKYGGDASHLGSKRTVKFRC